MLLKIAIQTPSKLRFCYIDHVTFNEAISNEMRDLIHKRVDFLRPELREGMHLGSTIVEQGYIVSIRSLPMERMYVNNFLTRYAWNLEQDYQANPNLYTLSYEQTLHRMRVSILEGSYNKDSNAFKNVCKHLGIKHTYKAINAYLKSGEM